MDVCLSQAGGHCGVQPPHVPEAREASEAPFCLRNPQLMKAHRGEIEPKWHEVLLLAGLQQGVCSGSLDGSYEPFLSDLANTFVLSNLRVAYWGERMWGA